MEDSIYVSDDDLDETREELAVTQMRRCWRAAQKNKKSDGGGGYGVNEGDGEPGSYYRETGRCREVVGGGQPRVDSLLHNNKENEGRGGETVEAV